MASVPRDDDPDGFYAGPSRVVGAERGPPSTILLTQVPDEQRAGLLQLIDGADLFGFKDQTQSGREEIPRQHCRHIARGRQSGIAALYQLSVLST